MTMDIQHVGLLGLGTMGAGIAQLVAQSGREVTVLETDQARIDAGTDFLRRFLDTGIARGKLTRAGRDEILGRVRGVTDPSGLVGTELVIEAVTEKRQVKRDLLAVVAEAVGPEALLVTNTSALSVTDLATAVPHPERFAIRQAVRSLRASRHRPHPTSGRSASFR